MKIYQLVSVVGIVASMALGSSPKNTISTGVSVYSGGTATVYGNYDHRVGCGVWGFGAGIESSSQYFASYNTVVVYPRISLHPVSLIEKLDLSLIFQPIGFGASDERDYSVVVNGVPINGTDRGEWKYFNGQPSLGVGVNYRVGKAFTLSSEVSMASRPERDVEYTLRSSFGVAWVF